MPHQCVHCGNVYPSGAKEILIGCKCGSHFFFYIKEEQLAKLKSNPMIEIPKKDKEQIEKDVREIVGIPEESSPIILDLESVRVIAPGKFEIDLVNLFNKNRPLIYKLEEGKYIIDLASTLKVDASAIKEIRNPEEYIKQEEMKKVEVVLKTAKNKEKIIIDVNEEDKNTKIDKKEEKIVEENKEIEIEKEKKDIEWKEK